MASLELRNVVKRFGNVEVIHGVDLSVDDGEFVVFVGPSGCGKSTLLRMIAGLEPITAGDVLIGGERVNDVAAARRGLAMVFQSYALYPHMTVRKNLSFGLETMGAPRAETKRRVAEAAEVLQISPLLDRRPGQLSGGQRQRVAIGRAIVREPRIFLFDEPLSNLDAELRVQMRVELNKLHRRLGATMIFVTHDQVEAMTLADRIVVLRAGVIEQVGTPLELYNRPANLFVAGFIGSPRMNFLKAEAGTGRDGRPRVAGASGIDLSLEENTLLQPAEKVTVGIRPEHLKIVSAEGASLTGEVQIAEHLGGETFVYVLLPSGETAVVEIKGQARIRPGESVGIEVDAAVSHIFAADGTVTGQSRAGDDTAAWSRPAQQLAEASRQ
ncbi:MAG: ugpC [Rhizobiaceae bacterium]|jgi:multiple sugar transport system ATP-binding protein|nr:ugpC [Rhizobiaceae bacterium]